MRQWNNATDLNYAAGVKFQSFLAKRAQNNSEIDPKMSKRACVFQVSVHSRQHFLPLSYVLRCKWLPERASLDGASCPLETTHRIPREKFARKPYNKSFIDQVCSVKMAGYCPRSLFTSLWTRLRLGP